MARVHSAATALELRQNVLLAVGLGGIGCRDGARSDALARLGEAAGARGTHCGAGAQTGTNDARGGILGSEIHDSVSIDQLGRARRSVVAGCLLAALRRFLLHHHHGLLSLLLLEQRAADNSSRLARTLRAAWRLVQQRTRHTGRRVLGCNGQ